ncbi:hypothetical protein HZS_40 [Henneguya salminicola]|uniref:Coiled-coil domain-containing protein 124 (Trinotate prediction) n=1 Tax=Henneguya salminicola TaxID=69463 RepID=A0A6G3MJ54_HENSL|nr:hypothetical protein HZS_40 [Henneguya salminicola]
MESIQSKKLVDAKPRVTRKEIADKSEILGPIGSSTGTTASPTSKSLKDTPRSLSISDYDVEEEILSDAPININRLDDDTIHAKGIDEALDVLQNLNMGQKEQIIDRHPEKRRRAAFASYMDREMIRLKMEQPTLTFSQREQIIFKNWQKSPENPIYMNHLNRSSNS